MPIPVYQLNITLLKSKPKICRKILVKPDNSLVDLHRIIQTSFGWSNSHLHLFNDGINDYSPKEFEVEDSINSRTTKLSKILFKEMQSILYEYDFGDGWEHEIILEKIFMDDDLNQIPRCIDGKRHCPPEDCGGIWGYEELLKIIANPKNDEYEEMMEWLGGSFDPERFNLSEINNSLRQKDYGCIWLE